MDEGILVPIGFFILVAVVFWLQAHFKFRTRADMQQTIRLALEKGNQLNPELLEQLANPKREPQRDLRLGLIWLSLGVGLALCGVFVPDPSGHALRGCLAGAAFPLAIGLAYMIMWQVSSNKAQ
jgi:hypothetical protein